MRKVILRKLPDSDHHYDGEENYNDELNECSKNEGLKYKHIIINTL
jgi:hypothetical protein